MKGIPPEIDALLWQLAEEGGPLAREEFERRHARYGPELARRVLMVTELRQAGKVVAHRPKFTPRPARVTSVPRWASIGAGGLAIVAIGTIAYVVAAPAERPAAIAPVPIRVPRIETAPAKVPPTVVKQTPQDPVETPVEEPPSMVASYLRPREVQMADTSLTTAISLVAAGGGLKVTVAPGFEDRKVTFDYRGSGLNTIQVLRTMGEQFGFSVLDEEEGSVLVIPAREALSDRRVGN